MVERPVATPTPATPTDPATLLSADAVPREAGIDASAPSAPVEVFDPLAGLDDSAQWRAQIAPALELLGVPVPSSENATKTDEKGPCPNLVPAWQARLGPLADEMLSSPVSDDPGQPVASTPTAAKTSKHGWWAAVDRIGSQRLLAWARYAAVLAVGLGLGWWTSSMMGQQPASHPPVSAQQHRLMFAMLDTTQVPSKPTLSAARKHLVGCVHCHQKALHQHFP